MNARNADMSLINSTVKEISKLSSNGNHKFEVVSLFSGGGGSSTGYRMAGGKVLAVNEFIPEAIKTYQANWPDTKILEGDVRKLSADEILAAIGKKSGELHILDGSPPCSGFSTAGSMSKGWGKKKKYSDSEQESVEDLFFEYIRLVEGVKPKIFVAENVSGLAKGSSKGYLNLIMRAMRDSGYHVECKLLNAKWLGIPQSRQRTIFVGVRLDLWKPEYKGRLHPEPLDSIVTLEDAFKGLEFTDKDRLDTNIEKYAVYRELLKLAKGGQSSKYFQLTKSHPKGVSNCITATTGNIGAAASKHWDNRAFSVSEIKRIMSIPDDYILTGTYQQQVERLGRMVPPLMMKAVAEKILEAEIL